ncbi:MAG: hypothetical protein LBM68_06140 [Bacteroidales bacterium]|jgi:hypothetical protein|nr:hypothetical protein [Bacteroidales bacterium]
MTLITVKNTISSVQMSVLMRLFDTWNMNVEISDTEKTEHKTFSQQFSKTRGMWQDYDIDGDTLRNEAWGIQEK